MVKLSFPGSLYFENTRKNFKSNLVLVVVHESKGIHWCSVSRNEKHAWLNPERVKLLSILNGLSRVGVLIGCMPSFLTVEVHGRTVAI